MNLYKIWKFNNKRCKMNSWVKSKTFNQASKNWRKVQNSLNFNKMGYLPLIHKPWIWCARPLMLSKVRSSPRSKKLVFLKYLQNQHKRSRIRYRKIIPSLAKNYHRNQKAQIRAFSLKAEKMKKRKNSTSTWKNGLKNSITTNKIYKVIWRKAYKIYEKWKR